MIDSTPLFAVVWELALFAGVLTLLLGLDDLAVDALWLAGFGRKRRWLTAAAPPPCAIAVFVPAWREAEVIGAMLGCMAERWPDRGYRVYVGGYPNDIATLTAAAAQVARDPRVTLVIGPQDGPTTKGDCLNRLWQRLLADRAAGRFAADAVLIHDAEDLVDPAELLVHAALLADADYVQVPVVPLVHPAGRLVSGHYCDEFAEAHGKELPVRAAIGALLPTAGVGCAFRVAALERVARGDGPFCAGSLTEDYELGLKLAATGAVGAFAALHAPDGHLIATRAYFPHRLDAAVRQKTRWMHGIALAGWDGLGWLSRTGGNRLHRLAACWMLWRDRRTTLTALALATGYAAMVIGLVALMIGVPMPALTPAARLLFLFNGALLVWRLAMRMTFTARLYGWRQGLLAAVRLPLANLVLMATARQALSDYIRVRRGATVAWDKTSHDFPADGFRPVAAERERA